MKKWEVQEKGNRKTVNGEEIITILLENRGLKTRKDIEFFLNPPDPSTLTPKDVGIDKASLANAITRITKAIKDKESIVVYADYDADGITAGAIMWEALHSLGASVMPYIPHRVEEGYGLSTKGIDAVRQEYHPTLIITVDHGIAAREKVLYAKKLGIETIVTDHHVKPTKLPDCTVVHTTQLCGAGVSWFVAKELTSSSSHITRHSSLELAAIGTIADMVPLVGSNRSIVKYGLSAINSTKRVGLEALMLDAGLTKGALDVYQVSHALAPRLNAVGRLEHAMDALRLICTKQPDKAALLAEKLGSTNRDRQKLTEETILHARGSLKGRAIRKLIFVTHESYNPGVIGLVAGKLMEEYYLPAIVVSKGDEFSKASARSILGFNIVEAIRTCSDILVDVGGHPMAAGFTVETKNLVVLQERLERLAEDEIDEEKLTRTLKIDAEIPLDLVTPDLYKKIQQLQPFGFGNPEPVFATRNVSVKDARLVGEGGKHLKLRLSFPKLPNLPNPPNIPYAFDAIAFNFGSLYGKLKTEIPIDIAYTIDMNTWNGSSRLQLKIRDIHTL